MLLDLIDSQIANGRREQNNLYENTVGNALAHGDSEKVGGTNENLLGH